MPKDKLQPSQTPMLSDISFPTEFGLTQLSSGKIRERFETPDGYLMLVTTDRISAFDRVLGVIPHKGQVLNRMSAFWFDNTSDIIPNHMTATPDQNVMICRPAEALPVEVVVRGVMKGVSNTSIWTMYSRGVRDMYGMHFRDGYNYGDELDEPVITPTTKAEKGGHDEPISEKEIVERGLVDDVLWERTREAASALFTRGQEVALQAGFMMIDTKIEFGLDENGELMVIDELFTPDSAGFWLIGSPKRNPEIYDKECLRIYFKEQLGYWGQDGVEPPLVPAELQNEVSRRYIDVFQKITGQEIEYKGENLQNRIVQNIANYYGR
jgi:phosphoribosylaminoimidazole-succinocarboxamide synthase